MDKKRESNFRMIIIDFADVETNDAYNNLLNIEVV